MHSIVCIIEYAYVLASIPAGYIYRPYYLSISTRMHIHRTRISIHIIYIYIYIYIIHPLVSLRVARVARIRMVALTFVTFRRCRAGVCVQVADAFAEAAVK